MVVEMDDRVFNSYNQKSTHFPFNVQSPYLVGSGPSYLYPYSFSEPWGFSGFEGFRAPETLGAMGA